MRCKLRTFQPEVTNYLNGNCRRTRSDGEVIVEQSVEEGPEQHRQAISVWLHVTSFSCRNWRNIWRHHLLNEEVKTGVKVRNHREDISPTLSYSRNYLKFGGSVW